MLPDQAVRVRGLAGGLDQLKGTAAPAAGLGPRTVSLKTSTPAARVEKEGQESLYVPRQELPRTGGHGSYERAGRILEESNEIT